MERRISIGIDYGTTRSAAAVLKDLDGDVELWRWDDVAQTASSAYKAPTVSLYDKKSNSNKCIAISHTANRMFAEKKAEDEYILIVYPKKHLQTPEIRGIPTIDVVATFLEQLKKKVLVNLAQQGYPKVNVTYCLTVPAIWNNDQKLLMRKAALKAKLIDTQDSDNLVIVLEPEAAAAHFVQYVNREKITTNSLEGKTVLVVDAGGGTVDIAALKISPDSMKEVCAGAGNQKGSSYINEKIIKDLANCFEENAFETWKAGGLTKGNSWYLFTEELEQKKCFLNSYEDKIIKLPRLLNKYRLKDPPKASASRLQLEFDDDEGLEFKITADGWKYYFFEALEDAGKLTSEMITRIQSKGEKVDYVWLVDFRDQFCYRMQSKICVEDVLPNK